MHTHKSRLPLLVLTLYFLGWILYFAFFWWQALFFDETGALVAGHVNIWGDWAAHFTMSSFMANHGLSVSESPFLIGTAFSYPFVADWISAWLMTQGWSLIASFVIPSFVFSVMIVVSLFWFFRTLFRSRVIGILASIIFLLNGGLGFMYFAGDVLSNEAPLEVFINPLHEYTRLDSENIKWISVIDSMIIPQRAFALGFPLTLLALTLLLQVFRMSADSLSHNSPKQVLKIVIAGIILGAMPLIHTHSFLAAGVILSFWMIGDLYQHKQFWRNRIGSWVLLGIISLSLALPLLQWFFFQHVKGFISWHPGWLANDFHMSWWLFWWKNWGITPLVGLVGWMTLIKSQSLKISLQSWLSTPAITTFIPFFVIFILANLFLFQPFAWDNTKLIVWSSLGISGLAGYVIYRLWHHRLKFRILRHRFKVVAVLAFIVMIASGFIDAYWIARVDLHSYAMYSPEELELADWVKTNTPADAVWLTGDQHNHFLYNLTGRRSLLTYRGWLWTHGYKYQPIESEVRTLFTDPRQKGVIQKYNIEYAVIGPNELKVWYANKTQFDSLYTPIKETANYTLYKLN